MNKNVLPVSPPPITTYPMHTAQMAIAATSASADQWLYNYNLNLMVGKNIANSDNRFSMLEFYPFSCPLVNHISVPTFFTSKTDDYAELFRKYIDNNHYIIADIDLYYISHSDKYKKEHDWQPILIYGYDNEVGCFKIAGFMRHLKYTFCDEAYTNIILGFENVKQIMERRKMPRNAFVDLISIRENYQYRFDIGLLDEMLEDYIHSTLPQKYVFKEMRDIESPDNFVFGWESHQILMEYLQELRMSHKYFDLRPFHILYQHKVLQHNRVSFLFNSGYISSKAYEELLPLTVEMLDTSNYISKLAVKFRITVNPQLISQMTERLNKIMDTDKDVAYKMLESIRSQ